MSSKTIGFRSPNTTIKFPPFQVKNYQVRHIVRLPYLLPYCTLTITKSDIKTNKDWDFGIEYQLPDYELDIN